MYGFNSDRSKVDVPKIYTSSTAPQEGSAGDLWLKVDEDEAYGVFDSSDGSLVVFRDEVGKYTDGQVIGTKTYYAGIEDITGETMVGWGYNATYITKVIIKDIFKPKTAYHMFSGASNLSKIDGIKNLDTSECVNMFGMFTGCGLTSLDLSGFDTSKVTDMSAMFNHCIDLTQLDLSSFNTSKVTNIFYMFSDCYKLTATLNIMNMPTDYMDMCYNAARDSGQLTLKYTAPVTSADIDLLVATKNNGNVVNGGQA